MGIEKFLLPAAAIGVAAMLEDERYNVDGHAATGWSPQSWLPAFTPLAQDNDMPVAFCIQWLTVESGGNPCAVGRVGANGPDGNPREIGIAQLYNPDDFSGLGVDAGKLRDYCAGDGQSCSRALTGDEMLYAASSAMALMLRCRSRARAALAKNGCDWSQHDELCATKLEHGLPGLVSNGLARVTAHLGRAPASWDEYVSTIDDVELDAGTEHYRSEFGRIFANATKTASVVA